MEMRKAYNDKLNTLLKDNDKVVVLDADLASASGTSKLYVDYPERTINVGISEANMISSAAGMSRTGLLPFVHSFAPFVSRRVLDQLYMSGVYSNNHLHIYASDPGYWAQHNGGTHTTYEDLSAVLAFPNITVTAPSDPQQFAFIMQAYIDNPGVYFTRATRKELPDLYGEDQVFELGKAIEHGNGKDAVVFAIGIMVHEALAAQKTLAEENINITVVDCFSLKPFDNETALNLIKESKVVIAAENHSKHGGLTSLVESVMVENQEAKPFKSISVFNVFGEVGDSHYLRAKHDLTDQAIVEAVKARLK